MKMVIPLCYSVVLSLAFYGVQKRCEFSKRFNFHFCQTLITFNMQIHCNALLTNLEIKIGISLCDSDILFLFKTKLSYLCLNFCWSDKYKINVNYLFRLLIPLKLGYEVLVVLWSRTRGKSVKIITPHLGSALSEVSCKTIWAIVKLVIWGYKEIAAEM